MPSKRTRTNNSVSNRVVEVETELESLRKKNKTPNDTDTQNRIAALERELALLSSPTALADHLSPVLDTIYTGAFNDLSIPANFEVIASQSGWNSQGTPYARVTLEWDAVEGVDVEYEIWARRLDGVPYLLASTDALTVRVDDLAPGVSYRLKIRARAITGSWSSFSPEIDVIPDVPAPIVPKAPTGFNATTNEGFYTSTGARIGRVTFNWNAVTQSTGNSAIDIKTYEMWERVADGGWAYVRSVDGTTTTVEFPSGTTRDVRIRAVSTLNTPSAYSSIVTVTAATPANIPPKAPTGLNVVSNSGSFLSNGVPISTIELAWSAVTQGTDNNPLPISTYEVAISTDGLTFSSYAVTPDTTLTLTIPYNSLRYMRVRAYSVSGLWSLPSGTVQAIGAVPVHNKTPPAAPTLTTKQSMVTPTWNGQLTTGATPPEFFRLTVQYSTSSVTGPWTDSAVPLTQAGPGSSIQAVVGSTVWVRFFWTDTLNRSSDPSAVANIKVQGVLGTDLDDAVNEALDDATQAAKDASDAAAAAAAAAAGKSRNFYQPNMPTGGVYAPGDTWYDTDDGYKLYNWNGNAWVPALFGSAAFDTNVNQTLTAANGKNKNYYQTSQPSGTAYNVGDLWFDTDDGYKLRTWSGSAWVLTQDSAAAQAAAAAKARTYAQPSAPTGTLTSGDVWIDTDDGNTMYRYNGTAWVNVSDGRIVEALDAAQQALNDSANALTKALAAMDAADGAITTYYQSDAPWPNGSVQGDDKLGDLWFDMDDNQAYRWNGTDWVLIQDNAVSEALQAAQNAQATADGKITTFYQNTEPTTNMSVGDLWFKLNEGNKPYRYNGTAWVVVQDAAIGQAQATANSKTATFFQGTAPTATRVGDTWFDTSNNNQPKVWNGTIWADARDGAIAAADTKASNALTAANGKNKNYYQNTQPSGTAYNVGDLWFNTGSNNRVSTWSGSAWVLTQDSAAALSAANGKNASFAQGTAPTATKTGDVWIDTANGNQIKVWNGTAWVLSRDSGIAAADSKASTALETANGKNKVIRSTSTPSSITGYVEGDQWWRVDTNNQAIGLWQLVANSWVQQTVTDGVVANLTGNSILANSITTQKLVVGDFTNLIEDEDFEAPIGVAWRRRSGSASASTLIVTNGLPGTSWKLDGVGTEVSVDSTNLFPVDPSTRYRFNGRAQNQLAGTTPLAYVRFYWFKEDKTASATAYSQVTIPVAPWADYTSELVAPADAFYGRTVLIHGNNNTSGSWWVGRLSLRRMSTAELIVDGSIIGSKIAAGAIVAGSAIIANGAISDAQISNLNAGKIVAGSITGDKLAGNTITGDKITAGTITASRLYITDLTNMFDNGGFENGDSGWSLGSGASIVDIGSTNTPVGGSKVLQVVASGSISDTNGYAVATAPGEVWYAEAWVRKTGNGVSGNVALQATLRIDGLSPNYYTFQTIGMASLQQNVWTKLSGRIEIPAGKNQIITRASVREDVSSGQTIQFDNMVLRRASTSELIVDGSIIGSKIAAGAIVAGSAIIADGAITNAKIGNLAVDTAQIANGAITNAKITELDAGKIKSGTIDAGRISASSISANLINSRHISIGDFTNMASGSDFENTDMIPWDISAGAFNVVTNMAQSGSRSLRVTGGGSAPLMTRLDVNEGEQYYLELWARKDADYNGTANNAKLRIGNQNQALITDLQYGSDVLTTDVWVKRVRTFTVPAGVTGLSVSLVTNHNAGTLWLDNIIIRRMTGSTLIEDGAITTDKIQANSITGSKIQAGTITGDRISANTISVRQLLVTSLADIIEDPSFETNSTVAWALDPQTGNNRTTISTTNPRTGTYALRVTTASGAYVAAAGKNPFQVEAGEKYVMGAWVRMTTGTAGPSGIAIRFKHGTSETSVSTIGPDLATTTSALGTTYVYITGTWTVPSGAKFAIPEIVCRDITTGKVYSVDDVFAAKQVGTTLIEDDSISTSKIITNAITTSKIIVTDLSNALENPYWETGNFLGWTRSGSSANWAIQTSTNTSINKYISRTNGSTASTNSSYVNDYRLPVQEGKRIRITGKAFNVGAVNGTLGLIWYDAAGAVLSGTGITNPYTKPLEQGMSGWDDIDPIEVDTPPGAYFASLRIADNGSANTTLRLANLRFALMNAAELVVDGGIMARHIRAESIEADHIGVGAITVSRLAADVGQNLDLSGNSSINLIIDTQIPALQNQIDQATANSATKGDLGAVQGDVDAIRDAQNATADEVTNIQTWFRVDAEGAHVGQTGNKFQTHVKPDRFEITENNEVTTWWAGQKMTVPNLEAADAAIANHQFSKFGTGTNSGTVIKRINQATVV